MNRDALPIKDLKKHWVLFANRSEAIVYLDHPKTGYHFVERFSHPDGHLKDFEIDADRPGRSFSSGNSTSHHSMEKKTSSHDQDGKIFARSVARALEHAYREERYTDLVIAAEPRFLGYLRKVMSPAVSAAIRQEIPKEYPSHLHISPRELQNLMEKYSA